MVSAGYFVASSCDWIKLIGQFIYKLPSLVCDQNLRATKSTHNLKENTLIREENKNEKYNTKYMNLQTPAAGLEGRGAAPAHLEK